MYNFVLAYRTFFKKGENNLVKILSLSIGLAVGLLLISKVFFDNSYDDFFPDKDRIFMIQSNVLTENEPPSSFGQVSGAIAPGIQREVVGVEASTRYTFILREGVFYTREKANYEATVVLADSCLFDIFPRPMLAGDAREVLSSPMYAVVSKSVAEKIGGDVIGSTIEMGAYPGREITIGGIFEDIPANSHLSFDVAISMNSIANFTYDGSENWLGNDRYLGYVKLANGVSPESLSPNIRKMQEKHQNIQDLEKNGLSLSYSLIPLTKIYSDTPETKRMTMLLSVIAFVLLFSAVMNYILIVISGLIGKVKTIAVRKCFGAEQKDLAKLIFSEVTFHLFISFIVAGLLILCFRGLVEEILQTSVYSLFSINACFFLFLICIAILLFVGVIPTYLFVRIPVASVFRNLKMNRKRWKKGLLFVQLVASVFMLNLLVIVSRQYDAMVNDNPGYDYENVMYCNLRGISIQQRQTLIDKLRSMPEVERVASSSTLLFEGQSGNNVQIPDVDKDLFNIADLYWADDEYFDLMHIPIIEGHGFDKEYSTKNDILVSKKFADKIIPIVGWEDGVIGKEINISEHVQKSGSSRIVGVYNDVRIGSISDEDMRPSAIFYTQDPVSTIFIRTLDMNPQSIEKVNKIIKEVIPDKEIALISYEQNMIKLYDGARLFKKTIVIGGIVTLIITLIGLVAYTNNEVIRRRYEIAIRKVNGAKLIDILNLFIKDNLWVALPSTIFGAVGAWMAAEKWMENFSVKSEISPLIFVICGFLVWVIIIAIVTISCFRIANQNPVKTLKRD